MPVLAATVSGSMAIAQPALPIAPLPGGCAPETLTRLVVRDISPGVAAADSRAQPRTMVRRGAMQLRSEELPDLSRGGETRLVIISEPDVWTIDLARRRGVHSVDPGPEFVVRAPVLPITPDLPALFATLEFGCEAAFVAANAPKAAQMGAPWGTSQVSVHSVNIGEHSLAFLMDSRTSKPVIITYSKAERAVFSIRYDAFHNDQPDNPTLFTPPKLVQIVEAATAVGKP